MDKQLLKLLIKKRKNVYADPKSVLKAYDAFLEANGIYHSFNQEAFLNSIKNKGHLCEDTWSFLSKATYDNEKEFLLNCLLRMGCKRNLLVEFVLNVFEEQRQNEYLWHYADFLYSLKEYEFLDEYLKLIMDQDYGSSREMLILLVGESKQNKVIPYLKELLSDAQIVGHVLTALSNFSDNGIGLIMKEYINHPQRWISNVAQKYLASH